MTRFILKLFLIPILFFPLVSFADSLPDLTSTNLASLGTLVTGNTITFSGNVVNYGTAGTSQNIQVPQSQGTPIITGSTWSLIERLSVAFDGNDNQNHDTGHVQGQSGLGTQTFALGKDWGAGNSKKITRIVLIGSNNYGLNNSGDVFLSAEFQGSGDGVSWTTIDSFTITDPTVNGPTPALDRIVPSSVGYRFHRIVWTSGNNNFVAEMKFFEVSDGTSNARFCIDNASCLTATTGELGTDQAVPSLGAVVMSPPFSRTWSATVGTHTAYLCADVGVVNGVVAESNEANNCSQMTFVVLPPPDLVTSNLVSSGTLVAGYPVTFSGNVTNQSGSSAGVSTARFCVDNPNCLTLTMGQLSPDQAVASLAVGAIAVLGSRTWTATTGTHIGYLCADVGVVNGVVLESNEANNCSQVSFTILAPPDFVTQGLASSGTLVAGNTITLSGTVKNQGGSSAIATVARFCMDNANCLTTTTGSLSPDPVVPTLAAGASFAVSRTWTAIAGTHIAYLCADVGNAVVEFALSKILSPVANASSEPTSSFIVYTLVSLFSKALSVAPGHFSLASMSDWQR